MYKCRNTYYNAVRFECRTEKQLFRPLSTKVTNLCFRKPNIHVRYYFVSVFYKLYLVGMVICLQLTAMSETFWCVFECCAAMKMVSRYSFQGIAGIRTDHLLLGELYC